MAYPLNYFRYLLRQGSRGRALEEEDIAIGREEVERLERMLLALRRLEDPTPALEPVQVRVPLQRALDLLREPLRDQGTAVTIEVPAELTVTAGPDPLLQVFANLLRNAVEAAGPKGCIGIRAWVSDGSTVLDVWDSGPGVPESLRDTLFNPWVTARDGGMGLGLAITERIVGGFGWTLGHFREDGRTVFRISCPRPEARS